MKKIHCILLVDDSLSTNFLHKKIIEISNEVENVFDVENGLEALDYICNKGRFIEEHPKPNIIFLDINMPKLDGFGFLEKYSKLPKESLANTIIVFLTTSNRAKDKMKALDSDLVYDFIEKPLKPEDLRKITNYYYDNFVAD